MKSDPSLKLREKVITIIKRNIAQSLIVGYDVDLGLLERKSGRTGQYDIVIAEGTVTKQTISLVEIQTYGLKPEISVFNGWVEKMRELGARHLICISELGFPNSIIEKADQIGPTVRLLTLKQLEEGNWSIPTSMCSETLDVVRYDKLIGLELEYPHFARMDPDGVETLPSPYRKIFRMDDGRLVSVTDLMDWQLFGDTKTLPKLPKNKKFTMVVDFIDSFEHKTFDGKWIKLKLLRIRMELSIRPDTMTWEAATYKKLGWGEIDWILLANTLVNGKLFDIVTPIRHVAPGEYRLGRPIILNDHVAFLSIGKKGYKASSYTIF